MRKKTIGEYKQKLFSFRPDSDELPGVSSTENREALWNSINRAYRESHLCKFVPEYRWDIYDSWKDAKECIWKVLERIHGFASSVSNLYHKYYEEEILNKWKSDISFMGITQDNIDRLMADMQDAYNRADGRDAARESSNTEEARQDYKAIHDKVLAMCNNAYALIQKLYNVLYSIQNYNDAWILYKNIKHITKIPHDTNWRSRLSNLPDDFTE